MKMSIMPGEFVSFQLRIKGEETTFPVAGYSTSGKSRFNPRLRFQCRKWTCKYSSSRDIREQGRILVRIL
jgi:hypothetical protein